MLTLALMEPTGELVQPVVLYRHHGHDKSLDIVVVSPLLDGGLASATVVVADRCEYRMGNKYVFALLVILLGCGRDCSDVSYSLHHSFMPFLPVSRPLPLFCYILLIFIAGRWINTGTRATSWTTARTKLHASFRPQLYPSSLISLFSSFLSRHFGNCGFLSGKRPF